MYLGTWCALQTRLPTLRVAFGSSSTFSRGPWKHALKNLMARRIFLKLRERLDVPSICLHAMFEKIQTEEFSYYGHIACMLLMGDLSKMEIAMFRDPVTRNHKICSAYIHTG